MNGARIIGDWGSTRLRLWRLEDGEIAEHRDGVGILADRNPGDVLARALEGWAAECIVLCGMAGARGGLHQTPYLPCPVSPDPWRAGTSELEFRGARLRITAGLACRDASGRPDVTRGEETQVFGAMALDPGLAGGSHVVLLPGTHSKWAWLDDGAILGFRTFMTGELFALLGQSSLLVADEPGGSETEGFAAGLARAGEGRALSSALFEARAAQLVDARPAGWARGFVSGLLIGTEIADAAPQGEVRVIGDEALAGRYAAALAQRGLPTRVMDGEACAIAGLRLLDDG